MELAATGVSALDDRDEKTKPTPMRATWATLAEAIPRVYGYFYPRVGGDRTLAEDLTQDTLLSAVKSSRIPEDADHRIRWVFTIARNKLIDHYRQQDRERNSLGARVPEEDAATVVGLPDLDLESLPVREEVIATLAELNPRHRAAIVLRYLDGHDVATVAESLFLSSTAAESLLARARASFRSIWLQRNGEHR